MNLLILATVVACISWTVTKEEIVAEFRRWCERQCVEHPSLICRKLAYLPTCYYCFGHWVAAVVVLLSGYRLPGWGWFVTWLTMVAVAQVLLTGFNIARALLRLARAQADNEEKHHAS